MNKSFVPFSASPPSVTSTGPGLRAKAVVDSKLAEAFRPITGSDLPASTVSSALHEPKVTLEREGSRVTCIKVQCLCGHIIELTCE
jgi:hypothetical protein